MDVDPVQRPADQASWFSQFFFLFISPVLGRGVDQGGLTQDDLPLLSQSDHPGRMVRDFLVSTQQRDERARAGRTHDGASDSEGHASAGGRASGPASGDKPKGGMHLFRRILSQYWLRYTISGLCLAVTNLSAVAVPIVMHELLDYLATDARTRANAAAVASGMATGDTPAAPAPVQPVWYGYALALALAAASAGQALVIHQFWYQAAVVCIHSEVILTSLVYSKSLSISNSARSSLGLTRGKLVNHMAVDACRLNETWVFPFLHWNTWSAAFTVSMAVAYLYGLLGRAGLLGCAVTLVFVPLSTYASRASKRYSESIQKKRDARGTLISEAVAGFSTLKAYCWTDWFGSRIADAREAEMHFMRRKQYLSVLGDFIGQLAPIAVMASTFGLFAYLQPGVPLTAAVAFAAMSWFDQLRQPLRSVPNTITTFVDASVSLKRLGQLLEAQDTDVSGMSAWTEALRRHCDAVTDTDNNDGPGAAGQAAVPMADWLPPEALVRGLDLGQTVRRKASKGSKAGAGKTSPSVSNHDSVAVMLGVDGDDEASAALLDSQTDDGDEDDKDSGPWDEGLFGSESWSDVANPRTSSSRSGIPVPAIELHRASFGWHEVEPADTAGAASGTGAATAAKQKDAAGGTAAAPAASSVSSSASPTATNFDSNMAKAVLHNISLACPRRSVTLVVGPVGSGKSSLLCSLVGETSRLSGTCFVRGSIAYAAQTPWVLNRSLRDNITFVSDFKQEWYNTVVKACALDVDAATFRMGHDTLVGDAGITLSGGQKQRLALARALYADADVYVLDDVLSAVDATVASHIWQHAVVQLLVRRGKTVIMATHAVHYTPRPEVDQVAVLSGDGRLLACGPYTVVSRDPTCTAILGMTATVDVNGSVPGTVSTPSHSGRVDGDVVVQAPQQRSVHDDTIDEAVDPLAAHTAEGTDSRDAPAHADESSQSAGTSSNGPSTTGASASRGAGKDDSQGQDGKQQPREKDKSGEETYAKGAVAARAMWRFIRAMGPPPLLFVLIGLYVVTQALVIGTTWWMALWVENTQAGTGGRSQERMGWYAGIYAALQGGVAVASLLRMTILAYGTMRAGTALHNGAISAVLDAPASFFASNPAGRITNRFLADVNTVDNAVRYSISSFALQVFSAVGIITVIAATTPYVLLWMAALSYVYYKLAQRYRISARDMRRLQSTAKSPILSHFSESLRGVATIRAFGPRAATVFVRRHLEVSAVHLRAWLAYWAANEYISCWLEVIGCCVILAAALLAVFEHSRGNLATGDVGLTLTYNMQIPAVLMWLVRAFSLVETDAVAIERLSEYCDIESEEAQAKRLSEEARASATGRDTAADGARGGSPRQVRVDGDVTAATVGLDGQAAEPALELTDLWLRYGSSDKPSPGSSTSTSSSPFVLRGLGLTIPAGAKAAVIGRTGAGKSTILQALLRMYPVASGRMAISGIDVGALSCREARLHATALLQDGFLFTGTIRDNLLGPLSQQGKDRKKRTKGQGKRGRSSRQDQDQNDGQDAGLYQLMDDSDSDHEGLEGRSEGNSSSLDSLLLSCLADVGIARSDLSPAAAAAREAGDAGTLHGQAHDAVPHNGGATAVGVKPVALDDAVTDAGANYSAGEKALLSLARALVRQRLRLRQVSHARAGQARAAWAQPPGSGLFVCDEPTAQVDAASDALVHAALLSQPDALLCICHRLVHVPRFDLVAVVDAGQLVEIGRPQDLLRNPASAFAKLQASAVASGHVRQ